MNSVSDLENAWKDSVGAFEQQLALNKKELAQIQYPKHWNTFINFLQTVPEIKSVLDIGCGTGAYAELCRRHAPNVYYVGMDYSAKAIDIAIKNWGDEQHLFSVHDYKTLNPCIISQFDLIHMGAFLDVLPNGDEALDFILSLSPKRVYIGRMLLLSREPSEYHEYVAYDTIKTCRYCHNFDTVCDICVKHNYSTGLIGSNKLWTDGKHDNDIILEKQ